MVYFIKMKRLFSYTLFFFIPIAFVYGEERDIFLNKQNNEIGEYAEKGFSFSDFLNREAQANMVNKEKDKETLREEWKDLLYGLDIFYPYFKTKEIENWLEEKGKLDIFNLKGKPEIEENEIFYVFRIKL